MRTGDIACCTDESCTVWLDFEGGATITRTSASTTSQRVTTTTTRVATTSKAVVTDATSVVEVVSGQYQLYYTTIYWSVILEYGW